MVKNRTLISWVAAACMAAMTATAGEEYEHLMKVFSSVDHRLAGSSNFVLCADAVQKTLEGAGMQVHRQTFDTLVPVTERCEFSVDGRRVGSVYPMENGMAPMVTRGKLSGRLVWVGGGSYEELRGKDLKDAIVVMDLAKACIGEGMANVFRGGALAVIFAGDDSVSQWRITDISFQGAVNVPRLYIARETAEKEGLFRADGSQRAELDVKVTLQDAEAQNLWVVLPGKKDAKFRLGREETVILSATLDTFGLTPDYNPQLRSAANAALLAETACRLAEQAKKEQFPRTVIIVFFGSRYAAQEGTRYFYYSAYASSLNDKETHRDSPWFRANMYARELEMLRANLVACDRPNLMDSQDPAGLFVVQAMKEEAVGRVNNANAQISEWRTDQGVLNSERRALEKNKSLTPEKQRELDSAVEALEAKIRALTVSKKIWNNFRRDINKRISSDDPAMRAVYQEILDVVRRLINGRIAYTSRQIVHNESARVLSENMGERALVGHFDLDFASAVKPWLFDMCGAADYAKNSAMDHGLFYMHLENLGLVCRDLAGTAGSAHVLAEALTPHYKPFSLSMPKQRSVPSTAASFLGAAGYQLITAGDPLDTDELPLRKPCDLSPLVLQVTALARAFAERPELSLRNPMPRQIMDSRLLYVCQEGNDYDQRRCVDRAKGSAEIQGAAQDAVLACFFRSRGTLKTIGLNRSPIVRVSPSGFYLMPLVTRVMARDWSTSVVGVGYDADGFVNRLPNQMESVANRVADRIPLFYAYGGASFSMGFQPDLMGVQNTMTDRKLNGKTDGAEKTYFSYDFGKHYAYFTDRKGAFKHIGQKGDLILGATAADPLGKGIPLDSAAMMSLDATRQSAQDYWFLNDSRLSALRKRNIFNDTLETMHADAKEHIEEAKQAAATHDPGLAMAHNVMAQSLGNRIHSPLKGITADLVRAVILLLLMSIPFAFVMERLIFGSTNIYRQVGGYVMFFVGTFLILFFTHPAFSLVSAPLIIFLAFVIIMLSSIVVQLVMSKIRQEIRAVQGLASTAHGISSDNSTATAAILIGISGMRNRPLKTFLTALTVVLLTFTILVFASFTSQLGVVETYLGRGQDQDRIELHRFSLLDLDPVFVRTFVEIYGKEFHVVKRGGLFRNPTRFVDVGLNTFAADRVIYHPASGKTVSIGTIMGIDRKEAAINPKLASAVPGFLDSSITNPPIYLAEETMRQLGVQKGEELKIMGQSFVFAGLFDQSALGRVTTVEGERITPPDFQSTLKNLGQDDKGGADSATLEQVDVSDLQRYPPERVAITDFQVLEERLPESINLNFIVLYPKTRDVDVERAARSLATMFQGAIHVTTSNGAKKLFFSRVVAGSGIKDVVVPLLLGGLIIFSSLMGSIVDRKKEIFTYSAMGLAPPDVGALFFAESAAYSVVGGMGGYLLGQLVAKTFSVLGSFGLMHPPEMNFSSLMSVSTILVVMAMVMLSTIYPAVSAGKSATPGVARKWKMPLPHGDHLEFVFPFTVSENDFSGILSYVLEHFENHSDATLGEFAARNVKLFTEDRNGRLTRGIQSDISLAPFDLGIFQKFRMYSKEFEIKGIQEVVVEIERVGGSPSSWIRSNRVFASDLRQQFLLWRSLPISTVEHYRKETQALLAKGA